jgi:hypothetical protein
MWLVEFLADRKQFSPVRLLSIMMLVMLAVTLGMVTPPKNIVAAQEGQPLDRTLAYLRSVYNVSVGLMSENLYGDEQGRKTFWLNDNLLVYAALMQNGAASDKALADKVHNRVAELTKELNLPHYEDGIARLGLHEAVLGYKLQKPLPCFRSYIVPMSTYDLGFVIFNITRTKECYVQDYRGFADIMLFESLSALYSGNRTEALALLNDTIRFWDGNGLADKPYVDPTDGQYQRYATYKLALLLYVAQKLNATEDVPFWNQAVNTIWRMRTDDGGIITNYALHGTPVGIANTETTGIVVLANPTPHAPPPPPPAEPPYLQILIGLVSVVLLLNAVILISIFRKQTR